MSASATPVSISEISVDDSGRMSVRTEPPSRELFHAIYRAGRGVEWDEKSQSIIADPKRYSPYQAFKEIKGAALTEHRTELCISPTTHWNAVTPALRSQIERWSSSPYSDAHILEVMEARGLLLRECLLIGSSLRAYYWNGRSGLSELFVDDREFATELTDFLARNGARRFESESDVERAYGWRSERTSK